MCWMAAIPIAMSAGQMVMGNATSNQQVAAQNDALRRQSQALVKQMNYQDANLKLEAADTQDDLRSQKTDLNMQSVRNMGTLRAAIGESGLEGNSMKRLQMVTQGDYARQAQGLNDNYERDYAAIFGKRLSNIEGTRSQIEENTRKEGRVKGVLEQIVDPLGLGVTKVADLFGASDPIGRLSWGKKAVDTVHKDTAKANGN